jgi:hypothetical protein
MLRLGSMPMLPSTRAAPVETVVFPDDHPDVAAPLV